MHIVVMGIAGAGKSTIARAVADRLGYRFIEGDAFHSAPAIAKMSAGHALEDADRLPWLDRLSEAMKQSASTAQRTVVACSALRRQYRDILRARAGTCAFVYLSLSGAAARDRLNRRTGHFMPSVLIDSQLAVLEEPDDEPFVVKIEPGENIESTVNAAISALIPMLHSKSAE